MGRRAAGLFLVAAIVLATGMVMLSPVWASPVKPAVDGVEGQRAFDDLAACYKDRHKAPPYMQALADLGKSDEATRQRAGRYLLALMTQARSDEQDGRSPVRASPFWGAGASQDARDIRTIIIGAFMQGARSPEALDAVAWLLEKEPAVDGPQVAMVVLSRIRCARADEMIRGLVRQGHPVQAVVAGALKAARERHLVDLAASAAAYCQDAHLAVRKQAQITATALGARNLPAFTPRAAFSPAIRQRLHDVAGMVYTPLPVDATMCRFTWTTETTVNGKPQLERFHGWLLGEKSGKIHVLDWFGRDRWIASPRLKWEATSLAAEAQRLRALRAELEAPKKPTTQRSNELWSLISPQGMLTAQFQAESLSLPEALVVAWLCERGDFEHAALILLPRLDALPDDRMLDGIPRDLLGHIYHQEMLHEFSFRRDYVATRALATHLSLPLFNGYGYQERARELDRQLARRTDDFKTFVLPTPEQWKTMKSKTDRGQQIRFLADHLRLLNCRQWGQPGGVSFGDPQDAFPMEGGGGRHPVINPLTELGAMKLQRADLRHLVTFLADEDFTPSFGYFRDFHPQRHLYRVNEIVADVFNEVAKQNVVSLAAYHKLDESGRQRYMEKLAAWCEGRK